jgi:hypothetical protein
LFVKLAPVVVDSFGCGLSHSDVDKHMRYVVDKYRVIHVDMVAYEHFGEHYTIAAHIVAQVNEDIVDEVFSAPGSELAAS